MGIRRFGLLLELPWLIRSKPSATGHRGVKKIRFCVHWSWSGTQRMKVVPIPRTIEYRKHVVMNGWLMPAAHSAV